MRIDIWPLQELIYNQLSKDAALKAAGVEIYDTVPKKSRLPFIALGDETTGANNTKTSTGESDSLTLHVWSAYRGRKEVKNILNILVKAIYTMPLQLPGGGRITYLTLENSDIIEEEEGALFHGVVRFSFIIRH